MGSYQKLGTEPISYASGAERASATDDPLRIEERKVSRLNPSRFLGVDPPTEREHIMSHPQIPDSSR